MKTLLLTATLVFIILSCNRIADEKRVLVKSPTDSLLVMDVPKAGCENCQKVIEGGLLNEKGVIQSILNLHTKKVSIVYSPKEISSELLQIKVKSLINEIPCK